MKIIIDLTPPVEHPLAGTLARAEIVDTIALDIARMEVRGRAAQFRPDGSCTAQDVNFIIAIRPEHLQAILDIVLPLAVSQQALQPATVRIE